MPISTAGEAVRAVIRPGRARGVVAAPPSKSMAHRLLICAGLARGESLVRRVTQSDDLLATVDCLRALGASLAWEGEDVRVRGCDPRSARPARLPCRESGSTLRFMIPLCLLSGQPMRLEGSETLLNRPLSVFEDICRARGFRFERAAGTLLAAGRLAPGEYVMKLSLNSATPRGDSNYYDTIQEVSRFIVVDDPAMNAGFVWSERVWGNFRLRPLEFMD